MAQEALMRACEVVGGQSPLASKLGVRQSVVWYWLNRSKKGVASEFCAAIERVTGVPAHELRPDIFSPPEHSPPPITTDEVITDPQLRTCPVPIAESAAPGGVR